LAPPTPQSPALWRYAVVLVPGILFYWLPVPGLNEIQRHLLAIFLSTIVALVVQPLPMGVSVLMAMVALALTRTLTYAKVLSGFSNQNVWLIFTAFLFARAVTATGFGQRVAYYFVRAFGHNSLTLGYAIAASNVALAPFIPSDTGRGGGIIFPITRSLAQAFQSEPGPTSRRLGSYLMLVGFQSTCASSAMFLTSMAANPMIAEFARKIGHVELTWTTWAAGAAVPGLLTMLLMPLLIYRLHPPEIKDTESARTLARTELARMGRMQRQERWLVAILLCVMAGWVGSPWHGIPNAFVAMSGVCAILVARVLTWAELLAEHRAWDALVWFAPLLMMADQLNETGVISVVSGGIFRHMGGWSWPAALFALVVAYLYVHYSFASMTAQATALYPGFLAAAVLAGAPPLLSAACLGYFSSLDACLTHYGTGSAPVFFGAGYVPQGTWWKLGFLLSVLHLFLWVGVGSLWWKLLGWW
jgi:divalent anion:Na+ symporter, DASS family